ncbi:MAG: Eco57I restriction-modification methylase domain-containing protein [Promethearchaeota archaeon]
MVEKNINSIGQVFTPDYIAEFMVKNALNFIPNKKLKVLEPSVGEGVFLKYLIQYNIIDITAYEIDYKLGLKLSLEYPNVLFKFENFLSADSSEKFDLIIGNPPYLGQNYNAEIFQEYVKQFPICAKYFVGNMDLFYFFIHQAITMLKPSGILSFITTNYWITKSKKTGIKLLKPHILEECFLLQYIDLSDLKLFKNAKGQHNCIFILEKKTLEEKSKNVNKNIDIIKVFSNHRIDTNDQDSNKEIFRDLLEENCSNNVVHYESALTNNELSRLGNWNLLNPEDVKNMVNKLEKFCIKNGKIQYLKDYFLIRNGIIFIQDDIFILKNDENLQIKGKEFFVRIDNQYYKLSENEKKRLKKIYKSKAIKPFGLNKNDYVGYGIFFNKKEFNQFKPEIRNEKYQEKYPILTAYLKQFEEILNNILINAKENPLDLFFPRRGAFIKYKSENSLEKIIDVEPLYENAPKIFFKFISSKNLFGFSNGPYYATSDTYFLWSKVPAKKLDYPFLLAYLNSKIVDFLFKAKNITIKRSKTKLEYGLPIPNLDLFNSEEELSILTIIRVLSNYLIYLDNIDFNVETIRTLTALPNILEIDYENLKIQLIYAIKNKDRNFIVKIIDLLFFHLFKLDQSKINYLEKKYY